MTPTLVLEPNEVGAKFNHVFSVLRLDQVDRLVRDASEEPFDVYVVNGPTLAAHRELGRAFAVADRSDIHDSKFGILDVLSDFADHLRGHPPSDILSQAQNWQFN